MTRNSLNRIAKAVALTVLAGAAAMAQDLKGTVPFDFTASGRTMPAGKYEFRRINTSPTWLMRHVATGRMIAVMSNGPTAPRESSRVPALEFRCAGESCSIAGLYGQGQHTGYAFKTSPAPNPAVEVATLWVRLAD